MFPVAALFDRRREPLFLPRLRDDPPEDEDWRLELPRIVDRGTLSLLLKSLSDTMMSY